MVNKKTETESKGAAKPAVKKEELKLTRGMPHAQKAAITGKILAQQPKRAVMLRSEFGEEEGATELFRINGYPYIVQKDVMVEVPEDVAKLIDDTNKGVDFEALAKKLKLKTYVPNAQA